MAAPIINPVAIVLFLISNRFLLSSTHYLHILFLLCRPVKNKNRFNRQKRLSLARAIYGTGVVFLSTLGA